MGGTIEVSSDLGKGSNFTVSLTLGVQEQRKSEYLAKHNASAFVAPKKILLVDDNEINLEIGIALLEDAGYVVDTATDGRAALKKVEHSEPDEYALVIMDIQMPVMDGYEATRAIRNLKHPAHASVPIVALSANTFQEDKEMAIACGMNAHLSKPMDAFLLYETIDNILGIP